MCGYVWINELSQGLRRSGGTSWHGYLPCWQSKGAIEKGVGQDTDVPSNTLKHAVRLQCLRGNGSSLSRKELALEVRTPLYITN